jgi:hypothetical protein
MHDSLRHAGACPAAVRLVAGAYKRRLVAAAATPAANAGMDTQGASPLGGALLICSLPCLLLSVLLCFSETMQPYADGRCARKVTTLTFL